MSVLDKKYKNERFTKSFIVLFLLLGTEMISFIPSILNVSVQIFSYLNVACKILIFILLILNPANLLDRRNKISFPFLVFFICYNIRMIYDLYFQNIYTDTFSSPHTYLLYLYFLCFIPALSIYIIRDINYDRLLYYVYYSLFGINLLGMLMNFFGKVNAEVESELRSQANDSLGSLTYGHLGVSLLFLAFFILKSNRVKNEGYKINVNTFLLLLGIVLGIISIFLSGSRSPLIALFVMFVVLIFGVRSLLKYLFFGYLIYAIYNLLKVEIASFFLSYGGSLGYRIHKTIIDGYSAGRDEISSLVIEQINNSPIFGDAFLITKVSMYQGFYPHNLLLEVLLVTGVFGFLFWGYYVIILFKRIYKYLLYIGFRHSWVFYIFIQYFLFGLTSKSLYTNSLLWLFGALSLNLLNKNNYKY